MGCYKLINNSSSNLLKW